MQVEQDGGPQRGRQGRVAVGRGLIKTKRQKTAADTPFSHRRPPPDGTAPPTPRRRPDSAAPLPDDTPRPTLCGDLCCGGIQPRAPTPSPKFPPTTDRDPPGAATYAAAASSRMSLPPCPRSSGRRPSPQSSCEGFAPAFAPQPPPFRPVTAPLPTAARIQNPGSRIMRLMRCHKLHKRPKPGLPGR